MSLLRDHTVQRNILAVILSLVLINAILFSGPILHHEALISTTPSSQSLYSPAKDDRKTIAVYGSTRHEPDSAKITKVSMLYGAFAEDERYQGALQNQQDHAKLHGHAMRVLTSQPMSGFWSKLSFMLQLVLEELERPEKRRTKWLL